MVAWSLPAGSRPEGPRASPQPWAWAWYEQVVRDFFAAYLDTASSDGLLPKLEKAKIDLLELILEKALAEVDAELEHRPEWVIIPLRPRGPPARD